MAVRTTVASVKAVLGNSPKYNYDGSTDLTPFLDSATVIVDRVATCAKDKGKSLTTGELELIERWLAAHCYAQMDLLPQSKSTSGASASFQGQTAMYLESTRYGQMAVSLDYSGCLAAIGKRQTARVLWLGKAPSDQVDYADRD